MVTSQPHRSGTVQAWWTHTGSTNRGFVSLDPERQREVESDQPAPRKSVANAFTFDVRRAASVRPAGRGKSAAKKAKTPGEPEGGGEPPAEEGGSRR